MESECTVDGSSSCETQMEDTRAGSDAVGFPVSHAGRPEYPEPDAFVAAVRRIGEQVLGPNAQESDRRDGPNPTNFHALAYAGLPGMAIPKEYGGLDVSGTTQRDVTEMLASYCGVTNFIQAQHHGPCRAIANSDNPTLKRVLLPDLAAGRRWCAVSFAHLRRPGPPVLRATPVAGGWRLDGTTPWVTGWGLMQQVMFGATLPDERFVYLWVPARRDDFPELFADVTPPEGQWGEMTASSPLRLCAMNASATVELTCRGLFVPHSHRLSESDRETLRRNDRNGVLGATAMPLGCTQASVRLLHTQSEQRNLPAIGRAAAAFQREYGATRAEVLDFSTRSSDPGLF